MKTCCAATGFQSNCPLWRPSCLLSCLLISKNLQGLSFKFHTRRYGGIGRHSRLKICQRRLCTGSSPVSGTKNSCFGNKMAVFCLDNKEVNVLSLCFFLGSRKNLKNCICRTDLGGKFLMHINICRGGNRTVSQPGLNILQADTIGKKQAGTAMPLRYNYDKPEKPRISRVFGYQARFFILFQPEKSSREVVIS